MWLAHPFIENFVRKIKKRDDFTGHNFQNTKPVPSRPANKPDGTGRPAILSRPVLNPAEQSVNIDANSELFSTTLSLITLKNEQSTTSNSEITTDSSSIYTNMTDSLNLYGNATTTTNANGE